MDRISKFRWVLVLMLLGFWSNANAGTLGLGGQDTAPQLNALTSTGQDGALFIDSPTTINLSNNQIFNFTTIDITSNGILNFAGISENESFTMLASGDITVDGLVNISANATFETLGSFYGHGSINVPNHSSLTLVSGSIIIPPANDNSGITPSISNKIPEIYLNAPSPLNDPSPILLADPVPEPSTYALLLTGLAFLAFIGHRASNKA